MRPKYKWTQILGVLICIAGLGLLVASDVLTDKDYAAVNMALGDVFMIIGASLYGFSEWLSFPPPPMKLVFSLCLRR